MGREKKKVWSVYELGLFAHTIHLCKTVKPVTHLTAYVIEVYYLNIKKFSGICKISQSICRAGAQCQDSFGLFLNGASLKEHWVVLDGAPERDKIVVMLVGWMA